MAVADRMVTDDPASNRPLVSASVLGRFEAETRMRVEWIAQGIEVEARGAPAADLAARLDRIVHPEPEGHDRRDGDQVDVSDGGRH